MSLRAFFPDTDRQDGVRSSLLARDGIAHLHLQQVQVSAEERRLATTPDLVAAGSRVMKSATFVVIVLLKTSRVFKTCEVCLEIK
ncbi:MAG: hypothetical protein C0393_05390 [Anaerolinea sp.]|nr:hypothetical protein [Anaerolinea sp.]